MEILGICLLISGALILFISEAVRADLVAAIVLFALYFGGYLDSKEALSGFSNPAVLTVIGMFILSAGLVHTGLADRIANGIIGICGRSHSMITAAAMLTAGALSSFMNNIGAVAVLVPAMFTISRKAGISLSKLLIPVSFGSLLGGLVTLIGTPPNLLISAALPEHGFAPFRLFDFAPTGIAVLLIGTAYMVFIGRHLIPERQSAGDSAGAFPLEDYLAELAVPAGSPLAGKSLREAGLRSELGLNILRIARGRGENPVWSVPGADTRLEAGDLLLAQGNLAPLLGGKNAGRLEIRAEKKFSGEALAEEDFALAEVVIAPNSDLIGRTIRDIDARRALDGIVLAIKRGSKKLVRRLDSLRLEPGDVLLVQSRPQTIAELAKSPDFMIVSKVSPPVRATRKAPLALLILVAVLFTGGFTPVDISIAALAGAVLMALTRCVKIDEMYHSVDWKVVFLIACMIPLGIAMDSKHTGAADWFAGTFLQFAGNAGPLLVLAGLFLFTTLLTEIMSNAAAAVLIAPISISISNSMGLEPYPFLMAVAIGASTTFLTPIGHQSNVLVYGIGNYKFSDFPRVGALLNLLIFGAVLVLIPVFWPFRPL